VLHSGISGVRQITPRSYVCNEIVWEYLSSYFDPGGDGRNDIYRAYRVSYDWIPQRQRPEERRVVPPDLTDLRIAP